MPAGEKNENGFPEICHENPPGSFLFFPGRTFLDLEMNFKNRLWGKQSKPRRKKE
jgi:hypothetical protein